MNYKQNKYIALYETKEHADCTFIFACGVKIQAHKLLLTLCSPVFERMLYGDMARTEIVIEDIEPDVFDKCLRHIYTGVIQLEGVLEAWQLFYVCQKYFLRELQEHCLAYVKTNLTLTNLAMCFEYAQLYDETLLATQCLDDVRHFAKGMLLCDDYHVQPATIRAIMAAGGHNAAVTLLAVGWAITECGHDDAASVARQLAEHDIRIAQKHHVDARLYKALDRDRRDMVDVYNELTAGAGVPMAAGTCQSLGGRFKQRVEFKNCFRLALRARSEIVTSKMWCTCDCMLFGLTLTGKSRPAHWNAGDYVDNTNVYVYLKDNETLSNLIYKHTARARFAAYEDTLCVVFDVPIVCHAYVSYMICVEYTPHAHGESVLLTYMSDKLMSTANKSKSVICFGDEANGSVVKGVCFYEV